MAKNELEEFCLAGLTLEKCERKADLDFQEAKAVGVDISTDFTAYRRQGECPCQAAWISKYNAGVNRV